MRTADPSHRLSDIVAAASTELIGTRVSYDEERLNAILSPRHFIDIRTTHGGPAPAETGRALEAARAGLVADQTWLARTRQRLVAAAATLKAGSEAL
jgi:hypothetical protein